MSLLPPRRWNKQPSVSAKAVPPPGLAVRLAYTYGQQPGENDTSPYNDRRPGGWGNAAVGGPRLHTYFDPERPANGIGALGNALVFDSAAKSLLYTESIVGNATGASSFDETMIIALEFSATSGTPALCGYFSSSFAMTAYGRGLFLSGGTVRASGVSASNGKTIDSGFTPIVGVPYVIAARFSASGALWINGQRYATGALDHVWNYRYGIGCQAAQTGGAPDSGSSFFAGKLYGSWLLRGGMSDGDLARVTVNPWPLFEPEPIQIYWPGAGGGAVNLVIQDATHGHTADSLALTQQHQLAVQDASHAHTADNLVLTQAHQLAVADATHAHAADNVTLSTELTLSIADALHGHSVDNITLVQQHVLVVDDATHGHSADNVVLATGTNLAVADASHAHTVDNLVLTQQHVLVVADAFHQHSADNVVLGGLPVAEVEEGGGGPDRSDEQPAERFTKDASGWRKPKWVQEREQIEAAAVAKPAEKPVAPADEREAVIASAQAADALAASLERTQPQPVADQNQPDEAPAQQTAAVDLERARIAAKVRQQREIEEIMTVLMMAA